MHDLVNFLYFIEAVFLVGISWMLFWKVWRMTNDMAAIRALLEQKLQNEDDKSTYRTTLNSSDQVSPDDDIRIWKKNGLKVKVIEPGRLGLLCKAIDGTGFMDYIPEKDLIKMSDETRQTDTAVCPSCYSQYIEEYTDGTAKCLTCGHKWMWKLPNN